MSQKNFFRFTQKKVANKSKRVGCLFIPFNVPLKTLWGVASVVNEKTRVKLKKPADRWSIEFRDRASTITFQFVIRFLIMKWEKVHRDRFIPNLIWAAIQLTLIDFYTSSWTLTPTSIKVILSHVQTLQNNIHQKNSHVNLEAKFANPFLIVSIFCRFTVNRLVKNIVPVHNELQQLHHFYYLQLLVQWKTKKKMFFTIIACHRSV